MDIMGPGAGVTEGESRLLAQVLPTSSLCLPASHKCSPEPPRLVHACEAWTHSIAGLNVRDPFIVASRVRGYRSVLQCPASEVFIFPSQLIFTKISVKTLDSDIRAT